MQFQETSPNIFIQGPALISFFLFMHPFLLNTLLLHYWPHAVLVNTSPYIHKAMYGTDWPLHQHQLIQGMRGSRNISSRIFSVIIIIISVMNQFCAILNCLICELQNLHHLLLYNTKAFCTNDLLVQHSNVSVIYYANVLVNVVHYCCLSFFFRDISYFTKNANDKNFPQDE